jgi:type IV pilus assembly protein PilE
MTSRPLSVVRPSTGFTLVEILVVMAMLSLLVAIALPSYASYIAKARRADARTQLMQVAQFMQRFYAANDSYQADRANNAVLTQIPPNLRQAPSEGAAMYRLEIPSATLTVSSFELRMVPVSGGPMDGDKCGTFSTNSVGLKGVRIGELPGSDQLRDLCWK